MSTKATFTFQRGNLRKLGYIPAYLLGWLLAWCVPRNPRSWVFGSGIGVAEGALALASALRERQPDARITWMVRNEEEGAVARSLGFEAVLKSSLHGFWRTLTARNLVVTHGLGDVQRFAVFRARIINLWHGAPIKKLHLDSPATTQIMGPAILRRLLGRMYHTGAHQVDMYVAGSTLAAQRLRSAFRVLPGKVRLLGDPRLDPLHALLRDPSQLASKRLELISHCGLSEAAGNKAWILYAPTWRDGGTTSGIPTEAEAASLRSWAQMQGVQLFIRQHPLGQGLYDHVQSEEIRLLSPDEIVDITPWLGLFDCVITDYSSVALDFAVTGRPVLWFAPDLEEYERSRGLYEPYEITTEGIYARSWEELMRRATDVLDKDAPAHRAAVLRTGRLAERFHTHLDGRSSQRLLDLLETLEATHAGIERQSVFFESFYGRLATCNPLALDQEISQRFPHVVRYWSVTREDTVVPEGAIPLLVGSPEWIAARKVVPLLIVNDWLRFHFRRRRHQFVVQTWHGTPLKKIALKRSNNSFRTRLAIRRESRRWSVLLSQNPDATTWLTESYGYRGKVLETGYPRNDRLANSAHSGQRLLVHQVTARNRLGVANDQKIVLYAPTWRDSDRNHTVNTLHVGELADRLGPEWTIIARGHARDTDFAHYEGARVLDATRFPDINELIIAADVCVTDYSSLMFDVSAAAVPTLLFVPDIETYESVERGFNFDPRDFPPGPLLSRTDEVVHHLKEFGERGSDAGWCLRYATHVDAWRNRWNEYDDGNASTRVVDWLASEGKIPLRSS